MCQENFASNYDIFTGKAKLPTSTLDEIHTGSLWEQARQNTVGWPICISPSTGMLLWQNKYWCIWFTFVCTIHLYTIILEQRLSQWWLKLHGVGLYPQSWIWKRKSIKTDSWDEITGWTQLSVINHQSNVKIHEEGGFWTEVMGWGVFVKLWIHFIAGDTSGHNNLVGHMNGGRPKFIYRDCRCLFDDLSSPIPMCSLITSKELKQAHLTEDGLTKLFKKIFPMLLRMSLLVT